MRMFVFISRLVSCGVCMIHIQYFFDVMRNEYPLELIKTKRSKVQENNMSCERALKTKV